MSDPLTLDPIVYGRRVPLEIWRAAVHLEARGNSGDYISGLAKIPKQYREGILFYSRGHGWRVRRQPKDWRQVFKERFPAIYAELTEGES